MRLQWQSGSEWAFERRPSEATALTSIGERMMVEAGGTTPSDAEASLLNCQEASLPNERLVRRFAEAWASHDLDRVMSFFSEDAVYRGSVGPEPGETWIGKGAIRDGITRMFALDAGSVPRQGTVMSSGDLVFAEWAYAFEDPARPPAIGCDLFRIVEDRIILKDSYRKVEAPQEPPSSLAPDGAYKQRRFRTLQPWKFGPTLLKVHLISSKLDREPYAESKDIVSAARRWVGGLLPAMSEEGDHFDVGYVILHEGEAAHWLLFHWWIRGGICCSIMSSASHEDAISFRRVDRPYMACVWESVSIEHERRAWVDAVLCDKSDVAGYVVRRLRSGLF